MRGPSCIAGPSRRPKNGLEGESIWSSLSPDEFEVQWIAIDMGLSSTGSVALDLRRGSGSRSCQRILGYRLISREADSRRDNKLTKVHQAKEGS